MRSSKKRQTATTATGSKITDPQTPFGVSGTTALEEHEAVAEDVVGEDAHLEDCGGDATNR